MRPRYWPHPSRRALRAPQDEEIERLALRLRERISMSVDDREGSRPTGPWSPPPSTPRAPQPAPAQPARWRLSWSTIAFLLIVLTVGIRAFRDLSSPEAWAYWKD